MVATRAIHVMAATNQAAHVVALIPFVAAGICLDPAQFASMRMTAILAQPNPRIHALLHAGKKHTL